MSDRNEIIEPYEWNNNRRNGLVYSNVLGWIDLGHAQGSDITSLLADFRRGEAGKNDYYKIDYTQKMHAFSKRFGTGKYVKWEIKKGRSVSETHSIALRMMMATSRMFEEYQASAHFSWHTDSGFSRTPISDQIKSGC